jgi:hypothetical protein
MGILSEIPEYLTEFNIIKYFIEDKKLYQCENCGSYLTVDQCKRVDKRNAFKYCKKCNNLPEIKTKVRIERLWKNKQTNLERYGTEFPAQNKKVFEKNKQTNLERYGSEYAITTDLVKEKIKTSLLKKYRS